MNINEVIVATTLFRFNRFSFKRFSWHMSGTQWVYYASQLIVFVSEIPDCSFYLLTKESTIVINMKPEQSKCIGMAIEANFCGYLIILKSRTPLFAQ